MNLLKILYAPIEPFGLHPERAYFAAGLFAILALMAVVRSRGFRPRHLVILITAVLWVLFSLNEEQAKANRWDIRVDLLVSWPLLLVASIWAACTGLSRGVRRAPEGRHAETQEAR